LIVFVIARLTQSMSKNPETIVTNRIKDLLKRNGAHFVKLSDSFTRGIPDAMIVTNRVIMMEFKVDSTKGTMSERTYKSLKLSGAQDHHIKAIRKRAGSSAYVVTDTVGGGRLKVWIPADPFNEASEEYVCVCEGEDNFLRLMGCYV